MLNMDRRISQILQNTVMREQIELLKDKSVVRTEVFQLLRCDIDRLSAFISVSGFLAQINDFTAVDRLQKCSAAKER